MDQKKSQDTKLRLEDYEICYQLFFETIIDYYKYLTAKNKKTGEFVLIKQYAKCPEHQITKMLNLALNEKKILSTISHPFMIKMLGTCQDQQNLYIVQEHVQYGQLWELINMKKQLKNDLAVFYAAQVIIVIESLHSRNIIFRNIDALQILIESDGYIKLNDFSIAKQTQKWAYSLVGNQDYMSPEMILNNPYQNTTDWYSLGILIYFMLEGKFPFNRDDFIQMCQDKINENYQFTNNFSEEAKSLVSGLLKVNPSDRLGSLKGGINDIKMHKWFKNINWKEIEQKKLKPLYQPQEKKNIYCRLKNNPTNIQQQTNIKYDENLFVGW